MADGFHPLPKDPKDLTVADTVLGADTGEVVPPYQLFDPLTPEEYEALKRDICERGRVLVPVELDDAGRVLDGHHRIRAWQELREEGVEIAEYPTITRFAMTEEQKRNHVRALNLLRRQLSPEQRNSTIAAMRADGMTLEAIGKVAGVDTETVRRNLSNGTFANAKVKVPDRIIGKDGKVRPTRYQRRSDSGGIYSNDAEKARKLLSAAPEAVRECCARWNVAEQWKVEDLTERFRRAERDEDPDSHTFWTIYHSGHIQCGDEHEAIFYPTAMQVEIRKADKWNAEYRRTLAIDRKREDALNTTSTFRVYQADVLALLPTLDTRFDLVIADPPYNVTANTWDTFESRDLFLAEVHDWLRAVQDVLKPQYNLFWFCAPQYATDVELLLRNRELPVQSRIVWQRRNMALGSDATYKFIDTWEMVFHCGNRPLNWNQQWSDERFDVQTFAVPQSNFEDEKRHPTQKPLGLIRRLVEFGSYPGDDVLDPFAGSGTTGHACAEVGARHCTLIEREEEYCRVITSRLGL